MTSLSQQSAENPINDLIDFASLKKQLENCAADSTAEHIGLLKQAVLTIDNGLKEIYQNGSDVNTVVYGRSNLTDQLIADLAAIAPADFDQSIDREIELLAVSIDNVFLADGNGQTSDDVEQALTQFEMQYTLPEQTPMF